MERTDNSGKTKKKKVEEEKEEIWERVAQQKSRGLNTACHCEHTHTESLSVEGLARYGTNN